MGIANIVKPEEYEEWIQYSQENQAWKQELHEFYGRDGRVDPIAPFIQTFYPQLAAPLNQPAPATGSDFFLPVWQSSPIELDGTPSLTNFDMMR